MCRLVLSCHAFVQSCLVWLHPVWFSLVWFVLVLDWLFCLGVSCIAVSHTTCVVLFGVARILDPENSDRGSNPREARSFCLVATYVSSFVQSSHEVVNGLLRELSPGPLAP